MKCELPQFLSPFFFFNLTFIIYCFIQTCFNRTGCFTMKYFFCANTRAYLGNENWISESLNLRKYHINFLITEKTFEGQQCWIMLKLMTYILVKLRWQSGLNNISKLCKKFIISLIFSFSLHMFRNQSTCLKHTLVFACVFISFQKWATFVCLHLTQQTLR